MRRKAEPFRVPIAKIRRTLEDLDSDRRRTQNGARERQVEGMSRSTIPESQVLDISASQPASKGAHQGPRWWESSQVVGLVI
jgi:hypothetical protein